MAENESLDITDATSARWRQLYRLVLQQAEDSAVADEFERCLRRTFRKLKKLGVPIAALAAAAAGERGDLAELVRKCREGRDYAQLFAAEANQGNSREGVIRNVLEATRDKFMEQFRLRLLGEPGWQDLDAFEAFRHKVEQLLRPRLDRLAREIHVSSTSTPRPAVDAKDRSARHSRVMKMSLLPV